MTASTHPQATAQLLGKRVPDFFVVGHPKSGTTALFLMLIRHPQIYMPGLKEPMYLSPDERDRLPLPGGAVLPSTLEEYLSLFDSAHPEQRVGEASPTYLRSSCAAGAIAELQPGARIIAILREPASFLRSLHLQFLEGHTETEKSFRKALALEDLRRQGKKIPRMSHRPQALLYSEHVRYVEQLRRYEKVFEPEQILVLIYDDFRQDNEGTFRKICRFLDVDDTVSVRTEDVNPTIRVRAPHIYELMHAVSTGQGPVWRTMNRVARGLAPRRVNRHAAIALRDRLLFAKPEAPDADLMRELRHRFKGEVAALSEHLDRDLVTLWGYDSID
jgi:hypothetical protein